MATTSPEVVAGTSYGPSLGTSRIQAEAPTFRTDERIELRHQKDDSRHSVEQTLQYRTQLLSGQDPLLHACFNPTKNHLVTVDQFAVRLWSLRRELRSFVFPKPVRVVNVHYAQAIDRYICLVVEKVEADPDDAENDTTSQASFRSGLHESEHATLHVFLPTLVTLAVLQLTEPGTTSAKDANFSGDIVASTMLQGASELVTGSRSGDVSVWKLQIAGAMVQISKTAGVFLESGVTLLSASEDPLRIAAAGDHDAACIEYTREEKHPSGKVTPASLAKTHDYQRAPVDQEKKSGAPPHCITALKFLERTTKILMGFDDGAVFCWDFEAKLLKVREHHELHPRPVTSLANLPGNGDYFSCGEDGKVAHWSLYPHVNLGQHDIPMPVLHPENVLERHPIMPKPIQLVLGKVRTSSTAKQLLFVVAGNGILLLEVVAPQLVLAHFPGKSILALSAAHSLGTDNGTAATSSALHRCAPEQSELVVLTDDNGASAISMADGVVTKMLPVGETLALKWSQQTQRMQRRTESRSRSRVPRPAQHHSDADGPPAVTRAVWDPTLTTTLLGCSNGSVVLLSSPPVFFTPPVNATSAAVSAVCRVSTLRKDPDALRHTTVPSMAYVIAGSSEGRLHCWKLQQSVREFTAAQQRARSSRHDGAKLANATDIASGPRGRVMKNKTKKKKSQQHGPAYARGKLVANAAAHTTRIVGAAGFHFKGGTYLVSGAEDGVVKVWEVPKLKMATFFCAFDNDGVSLTSKPQMTAIVCLGHMLDAEVVSANDSLMQRDGGGSGVSAPSAHPPRVVCGMANGAIIVWPLPPPGYPPAAAPEAVHLQHHQRVTGLALSPASVSKDLFFLSCSLDQTVVLWSGRALQPLKIFSLSSPLSGVSFSYDGSIVAYGGGAVFTIRGPKTRGPVHRVIRGTSSPSLGQPSHAGEPSNKSNNNSTSSSVQRPVTKVPTLPHIKSSPSGSAAGSPRNFHASPRSGSPRYGGRETSPYDYDDDLARAQASYDSEDKDGFPKKKKKRSVSHPRRRQTTGTIATPTAMHKRAIEASGPASPSLMRGRAPIAPPMSVRPAVQGLTTGPNGRLTRTFGIGDYPGSEALPNAPIVLKPVPPALQQGAAQQRIEANRARPHKLSTFKRIVRDVHGEAHVVLVPIDDLHQEASARARNRAASKLPPSEARVDHRQHRNPARKFNPDLTDSDDEPTTDELSTHQRFRFPDQQQRLGSSGGGGEASDEDDIEQYLDAAAAEIPTSPASRRAQQAGNEADNTVVLDYAEPRRDDAVAGSAIAILEPQFPECLKDSWFVEPVYETDPVTGLTRRSKAPPVYPALGQTAKLPLLADVESEIWSMYVDMLATNSHLQARTAHRGHHSSVGGAGNSKPNGHVGVQSGLLSFEDVGSLVYAYFLRQHGVQQLAQQKIMRLLDSMVAYRRKSVIVQLFAKFIGLFPKRTAGGGAPRADLFTQSTFCFFLTVLDAAGTQRKCFLWPSARNNPDWQNDDDLYSFESGGGGSSSSFSFSFNNPTPTLDRAGLLPVNKRAQAWIGRVKVSRRELATCIMGLLSGGVVHPDMLAQLCAQLNPRRSGEGGPAGTLRSSVALQALVHNGAEEFGDDALINVHEALQLLLECWNFRTRSEGTAARHIFAALVPQTDTRTRKHKSLEAVAQGNNNQELSVERQHQWLQFAQLLEQFLKTDRERRGWISRDDMVDILQHSPLFLNRATPSSPAAAAATSSPRPSKTQQQKKSFDRVLDRFEVDTTHLAPVRYNDLLAAVHQRLSLGDPIGLDEVASTPRTHAVDADPALAAAAAARDELVDILQEYEWALYLPSLRSIIDRMRLGEDAFSPRKTTRRRRKRKKDNRNRAKASSSGSNNNGGAGSSSGKRREQLFGLRGPPTARKPLVQEQPLLDLGSTVPSAAWDNDGDENEAGGTSLLRRRGVASIVRHKVNRPAPRGLEVMHGGAVPRKLGKGDADLQQQGQHRGRDPFFLNQSGDAAHSEGGGGGATLGYFQWPEYLRLAFQGEILSLSVSQKQPSSPQRSSSSSSGLTVFNKNVNSTLQELVVNVTFQDVERQKRLWDQLPELLARGEVSRSQGRISFPLMTFPAIVSLFEHIGVNVAWYARELAERLSNKLKQGYSNNGSVSGASQMERLQAMVLKLFALDSDYILNRGKGWNAVHDIAGGGDPGWSSVHVRRILTRREHANAAEFHRMQVLLALCSRTNFQVPLSEPSPRSLRLDVFGESSSSEEDEEDEASLLRKSAQASPRSGRGGDDESTWASDDETFDPALEAARQAALDAREQARKGNAGVNVVRRPQKKKLMTKQDAAVKIQQHARSKLARLQLAARRQQDAALTIQSVARLYLNHRRVQLRIAEKKLEEQRKSAAEFALWQATMQADKQRAELAAKMERLRQRRTAALAFLRNPIGSTKFVVGADGQQRLVSCVGVGVLFLRRLQAEALLRRNGRWHRRTCEAEAFLRAAGAQHLDTRRNWKRIFHRLQADSLAALRRFGSGAKARLSAQIWLRRRGEEDLAQLQEEYENAGKYERLAQSHREAITFLRKTGHHRLQCTRAMKHLQDNSTGVGPRFLAHCQHQAQCRRGLTRFGEHSIRRIEAEKFLRRTGEEILFVTLPRILEAEREEREARLRAEEEERRRKAEEEEENKRLLAMLNRQRQRTKRNWNLARGKIGSSMRVWNAMKGIADGAAAKRERVKNNMAKMQKAKLAMTVLKAARMHRERTKTTDADVREKYPLRVTPADPRQVKVKKGAFMEDISLKALIHSSEESYLPRWNPNNASDDEDEEAANLVRDDDLAKQQAADTGEDPLNFQFRTPIVDAETNLVDTNSHQEALDKWANFFDNQDSSKIVGKDALMSDTARDAEAEAEALQQDYLHLIEGRKRRSAKEQERRLAAAKAARRAAERSRLEELERLRRERLARGEDPGPPIEASDEFSLRDDRARRLAALRLGELKVERLPIDKVVIRQIFGAGSPRASRSGATSPAALQAVGTTSGALPGSNNKQQSADNSSSSPSAANQKPQQPQQQQQQENEQSVDSFGSQASPRLYFSVKVAPGAPLLLELSLKRGVVDIFVDVGVPPSREDNVWQLLDIETGKDGRLLIDTNDPSYRPGTYFICVERSDVSQSKGCRFGIRASHLAADHVEESAAMRNADRQLEKLRVIHSQVDQFTHDSDDDDFDGEDADLDDLMARLAADLRAQGMTRAATDEESAAAERARRSFTTQDGRVFYIGDIVNLPRTRPAPPRFRPEKEEGAETAYNVDHHMAAMRLQAVQRGRIARRRSRMTMEELEQHRQEMEAAKMYMAKATLTGKVVGDPDSDGVVPITYNDDGMDAQELATTIAAHNGGHPEPKRLPRKRSADEDGFDDDVASEVSSVASLPDELKQRFLEFDFSSDDDEE